MTALSRFHEPGLGTLFVHVAVICAVGMLLLPLMLLRLVLAPLAEGLIRLTDRLGDVLAERLGR